MTDEQSNSADPLEQENEEALAAVSRIVAATPPTSQARKRVFTNFLRSLNAEIEGVNQ